MKISARSSKESCLDCCAESSGVTPEVACLACCKGERVSSHLHPPQLRTHAKHVTISRAFVLVRIAFPRLAPSRRVSVHPLRRGNPLFNHSPNWVTSSLRFFHVTFLLLRRKLFLRVVVLENGNDLA